MSIRFSRLSACVLVAAAMVLMSAYSWAIFNGLPASKDDWKLKYDVEVNPADSNTLSVMFTLADEGRLKPIHSITLVAFSRQTDSQGGRAYDLKVPIELKPTADGKRVGQVQIRKDVADRAMIRILTLSVDGKQQQYAAFYDIPLKRFLTKSP